MKNILFSLVCAGLVVMGTSCTDFLEEEPRSEMGVGQYFSAPEHAQAAVNQLYNSGVPVLYDATSAHYGMKSSYGSYLSGFYDNEYKGMDILVQFSQVLTISPANIAGEMDNIWDNCYTAIARANTAIKYIPSTPGLTEQEQSQLIGQAAFFRALNYFYLVKAYGDVPLIVEPYESLDNLYMSRTASSEVYEQIISDLETAVSSLNDEAFTNNGHRISKGTAETLLANVYLNMSGYPLRSNHYEDAARYARCVINSGKYALLTNGSTPETSAYNQIRTLDNSEEYIYTREYEAGISSSGWRPAYCLPSKIATLSVIKYSSSTNICRPVAEILNVYDPENDLRIQEKQFLHTSFTYTKDGVEKTETFDPTPYLWYDEDALLNTGIGSKDYAIYRYAEVLLIAAEAIAESEGVTAEAVGYLADVRSRAYTKQNRADIINALLALPKDEFVHEIWTERIRELLLEDKLWWDIQRTRKYPVTSADNKGEVTYVDVVGAQNVWGATFEEKHLLWPISNNEMQRNPSLQQNPGYTK